MGAHSSKGPRKRLFNKGAAIVAACVVTFGGLLPALPAFATDEPTTDSTSTTQIDGVAPAEPTTEAPPEDTPSDSETTESDGGDPLAALRLAPAAATTLTFDWDWKYADPTCTGLVIAFPADLPDSQSGVIEVNVTGGSLSGRNYKLEGDAYTALYPHGHAGQTVTILWTDPLWRNVALPATGTWTITGLQVHGTNYHWAGSLTCGSDPPPPVTQKVCVGSGDITWTKNANLSQLVVTLKAGIGSCYVSLYSYETEGPTWATSGTQIPVDFDTVKLTSDSPTATLNVDVRGCNQQQDAALSQQKFDGTDGPVPHWPDVVVPTGLFDHWNGSAPCDTIDQPCTRVAPDKSAFAPNPDETGPAMGPDGAAFSKGTLLHTPVAVPLAGINGLGYTIVSSDGPDAAYKMEVLTTGTGGYKTFNWEPSNNEYATDATGTFTNLEDGQWWATRMTGPGSQGDTITLAEFELLFPNALIISYGGGQGTTTNATTVVSEFSFLCGTTPLGEEPELTKATPALPYKYCPTEPTSSPQQPTVEVPGVWDPVLEVWVGDHGVTNLAEDTVTDGVGIQRYETTPLDGEEFEESTDGSYEINDDGSITTILTFDGTPCPYTTPPILVGPTFPTLSCPAPADKPLAPVLDVPGVQDADDVTLWHSDDFDTKIVDAFDDATGLGTYTATLTPLAGKAFEESTDGSYVINDDGRTITKVLTGTGLCPAKDKPSGGANFGASGDETGGMQQSATTQVSVLMFLFYGIIAAILALLFVPRLRARFGAGTN